MEKQVQHLINPDPKVIQSIGDKSTSRLIYYLFCVKKLDDSLNVPDELFDFSEHDQIDLTRKQNVLAFAFKYSPDVFLNKSAFLIENREDGPTQSDHYFKEVIHMKLDTDFNLIKTMIGAHLFFKLEWLHAFYFKPIEELSSSIKEVNQSFCVTANKKIETCIG